MLDCGLVIEGLLAVWCIQTILGEATVDGNLVVIKLLIDQGADVNAAPKQLGSRTPLPAAAQNEQVDDMGGVHQGRKRWTPWQ